MGSSNPGGVGIFTKLSDITLSADGRFNISDLSGGHVNLRLVLSSARTDVAGVTDGYNIFFNDDTTAVNYLRLLHRATNAAHSTDVVDDSSAGILPGDGGTADYVGSAEITIHDYTSSKNKIAYCVTVMRGDATVIILRHHIIHWENTAAITQVSLQPDGFIGAGELFLADTRLQIYGIN